MRTGMQLNFWGRCVLVNISIFTGPILVRAAYLITRIPDIGLPGRAVRELIWSQYFPPPCQICAGKKAIWEITFCQEASANQPIQVKGNMAPMIAPKISPTLRMGMGSTAGAKDGRPAADSGPRCREQRGWPRGSSGHPYPRSQPWRRREERIWVRKTPPSINPLLQILRMDSVDGGAAGAVAGATSAGKNQGR
jgi:hypothetical protein